jgi:hypothetical protein
MATVHFAKDGKRPNGERFTTSAHVLASSAAEELGHFQSRYTETPPTINPEVQASDLAGYRHVVLEISPGEGASPFSKPGYYYIIGLTPTECKRLLDVSAPTV